MPRHPNRQANPRTPAPKSKPPIRIYACEADVLEGLETIAIEELEQKLKRNVNNIKATGGGRLRFRYGGDLRALLGLRSIQAVYLVNYFAIPRPKALLGHQHLTTLLQQIALVRSLFPAETFQSLRISAAGEDSATMTRLRGELAQQTGLADAEEADLLLRLRRSSDGTGWEVLTRISPRPLATRAWRVCNRPGAPNATLAHAMMRLSQPHADDRVLNLACGSGTLLVERLALAPTRSAIGCDIDASALDCARQNLRAAGFGGRVRLEQWDATQVPLADASATMICADLPFGQLSGSHDTNLTLYPRIFAEASRLAAPQARMVLLTHEVRLLEQVAQQYAHAWAVEQVVRVRSSGMTPRVFVLRRLG